MLREALDALRGILPHPKEKQVEWKDWVNGWPDTYPVARVSGFSVEEAKALNVLLRWSIHQDAQLRELPKGIRLSWRTPHEGKFNFQSSLCRPDDRGYPTLEAMIEASRKLLDGRNKTAIAHPDIPHFGWEITKPHPRWVRIESFMLLPDPAKVVVNSNTPKEGLVYPAIR